MIKVLNTRPVGQNRELSALLSKAGFEPIEIPLVDIFPLEDGLRKMLRLNPSDYTGIFLSGPNGIRQMQAGLDVDFEDWMRKPFYLVGGKSKGLIESLGGQVMFYPKEASVEGFLKEYTPAENTGGIVFAQRWLHPCSVATHLDPAAFRKLKVEIDNVPVYRPELPSDAAARLHAEFKGLEAALFCSASAVDHFFKAAPELGVALGTSEGMLAISIGPSTSRALSSHGVEIYHQASSADSQGLVKALKSAFSATRTRILKKHPEKKA